MWAVKQFFAAREIRDAYNETRPGEHIRVVNIRCRPFKLYRIGRVEEMDADPWLYAGNGRLRLNQPRG